MIVPGQSAESFHIGNAVPIWESPRASENAKQLWLIVNSSWAITKRNLHACEPLASRVLTHCQANRSTRIRDIRNRRAAPRSTIHTRDPYICMDSVTEAISGSYSRRLHLRSLSVSQAAGPC